MTFNEKFMFTVCRSAGRKVSKNEISKELDVTHKTLNNKIAQPGSFKVKEVDMLRRIYNLTDIDILELFFNDGNDEPTQY